MIDLECKLIDLECKLIDLECKSWHDEDFAVEEKFILVVNYKAALGYSFSLLPALIDV